MNNPYKSPKAADPSTGIHVPKRLDRLPLVTGVFVGLFGWIALYFAQGETRVSPSGVVIIDVYLATLYASHAFAAVAAFIFAVPFFRSGFWTDFDWRQLAIVIALTAFALAPIGLAASPYFPFR